MRVGQHLNVEYVHLVLEHLQVFHRLVELVGDQQETFHTRRYDYQRHRYAEDGVEDTKYLSTIRQR